MTFLLEQSRFWLEQLVLLVGYPGIALAMLAETLFPPIPSELVMPLAGSLVAQGRFHPLLTVIAGTVGTVGGALLLYHVGRWADEALVRRFLRRYGRWLQFGEADLERGMRLFDRYGAVLVLGGRLIPIVRSLISLPAGMRRMGQGRFLLLTALGSLLWNSALTTVGMVLGEAWPQIMAWTRHYERLTLLLFALLALALLLWAGAARWSATRQPQQGRVP